jgi:hypothetical protein
MQRSRNRLQAETRLYSFYTLEMMTPRAVIRSRSVLPSYSAFSSTPALDASVRAGSPLCSTSSRAIVLLCAVASPRFRRGNCDLPHSAIHHSGDGWTARGDSKTTRIEDIYHGGQLRTTRYTNKLHPVRTAPKWNSARGSVCSARGHRWEVALC